MAQWQCDECGFRNKTSNEVCGGTGPVGCKAPAPGNMVQWHCDECGFRNKSSNEVCGGTGPVGCKAPAPGGSSFGPARRPKGCKGASPYGFAGKGAAKGGKPGEWPCHACGFSNRDSNEVCGGNGPMGCKAPRSRGGGKGGGYGSINIMKGYDKGFDKGYGKGSFGGGGPGGPWMCGACGFKNSPNNQMCGGTGPVGCKAPGPQMGGPMYAEPPMAFKGKGKMDFGGKGKGGGKGEWKCEDCGFSNKPQNTQCGGTGPMGCNAPKPSDWLCDCGFVNKPHNNVCGGAGGKLGCKAPKPGSDDDVSN